MIADVATSPAAGDADTTIPGSVALSNWSKWMSIALLVYLLLVAVSLIRDAICHRMQS